MLKSIWDINPENSYPTPGSDMKVDAVVVGGGITGLTTAYFLLQAGLKVALIERHNIASRTSAGTTAHLSNIIDYGYYEVDSKYGADTAKLVAQSMNEAIDIVENIISHLNLEAEFRRIKAYYYSEDEDGIEDVEDEFEYSKKSGLLCSELYSLPAPIKIKKGFSVENNATFHPTKYLHGLAAYLTGRGAMIFENTNASLATGSGPYTIKAGQYKIEADYVVSATHTPYGLSPLHTELPPYKSYVYAVEVEDEIEDALYYDTDDPYHYIRKFSPESKILIIGGADHKTAGDSEKMAFLNLEKYIAERFKIQRVINRWSAQFYNPSGGLPFIGREITSKNKFIATGFNGDGMIFGSLSGKIITDLISGKASPYEDIYKPARIPVQGAKEFVMENLEVAYRFIKDRFSAKSKEILTGLQAGSGAVINYEGKRTGVYKDDEGNLFAVSATCVHMGCIVQWNNEEKTWDCNCHGGRYSPHGNIIEGPPNGPLPPLDIE